jgi:hypothetical protein
MLLLLLLLLLLLMSTPGRIVVDLLGEFVLL